MPKCSSPRVSAELELSRPRAWAQGSLAALQVTRSLRRPQGLLCIYVALPSGGLRKLRHKKAAAFCSFRFKGHFLLRYCGCKTCVRSDNRIF